MTSRFYDRQSNCRYIDLNRTFPIFCFKIRLGPHFRRRTITITNFMLRMMFSRESLRAQAQVSFLLLTATQRYYRASPASNDSCGVRTHADRSTRTWVLRLRPLGQTVLKSLGNRCAFVGLLWVAIATKPLIDGPGNQKRGGSYLYMVLTKSIQFKFTWKEFSPTFLSFSINSASMSINSFAFPNSKVGAKKQGGALLRGVPPSNGYLE